MHLRRFAAGVGLLATARALLIVPNIPVPDEVVTTLPVPAAEVDTNAALMAESKSWTLNLDCPGCPLYGRAHRTEVPSHLKLDFSIQSTEGTDRLTVNGYELYPNPDPIHNAFTAPVLPEIPSRRIGSPRFRGGLKRPQKSQPLGFAMGSQTVTTGDDDDLELIVIEIQIFEVGSIFVEGVPRARVNLVKTLSGQLGIGSVETIGSSEDLTDEKKECSTQLCKWKALFSEKLLSAFSGMGCRGRRPGSSHSDAHANGMNHDQAQYPHYKGHKDRILRVLIAIATHVVLPVSLGLLAGISVGIVITTIIAFSAMLWSALFRRSDRPSCFNRQCLYEAAREEEVEDGADVEKAGLLDNQEEQGGEVTAPPPYEEEKKTENAA
ncbi:hypothetical protein GGR50DRAFT_696286 [Xylaria sp. CBS 124048]|nr:hypothetical protein GGR50DRAFT_696286 [Xylaria sp. CBS 124048]